eukprot:4743552-Pyramimonas_sp.AAC.1
MERGRKRWAHEKGEREAAHWGSGLLLRPGEWGKVCIRPTPLYPPSPSPRRGGEGRMGTRESDLEQGAKYEAKAAHYAPLVEELVTAGWNVHHTTHVLTIVGVRATVPLRNLARKSMVEVLEGLQMPKKDREELQSTAWRRPRRSTQELLLPG